MEGSNEQRKKTKTTTRLQKRAPAALQLHGITTGVSSFEDGYAIPLLSPLLFSPLQPVVKEGKGKEPAAPPPGVGGGDEGWKHPALAGMMEEPLQSKLGARFQLQCMLTDNL